MRHVVCTILIVLLVAGCGSTPPASPPAGPSAKARSPAPAVGHTADGHARSEPDRQSLHCMALTMYWEARGEGRAGMLAVGAVVMNRVHDHRFPDSVCGVVYQGGETPPCQFSWWCDGRSDRPTNQAYWSASLDAADEILSTRYRDPTRGALFFHNTSIAAPWRRTRTAQIGNHVFYR